MSGNDQPIEGIATEEEVEQDVTRAIQAQEARRQMVPTVPAPTLAVAPRVTAGDLVKRLEVIKTAAEDAMQDGVDFGVIPGTSKPTLLKPGAEKLGVLFELDIQLAQELIWDPPHLTVVSRATVYHAPTGTRLGYGEGICTTHEKKYAKRTADRKCPDCGAEAILLSRDESEGFFCWKKRGGCGHKFPRDDERITKQETGEIDNPNLPDTWNTVVKIAEKRARVDAVLAVTGASAIFTQDVEDMAPEDRRPDTGADTKADKPAAAKGKQGDTTTKDAKRGERGITPAQKAKITKLLNAKIPAGDGDRYHKAIKENASEKSAKNASGLIGALELLDVADPRNVANFLGRFGIEWAPTSEVPVDEDALGAEEEAIRRAQGEAPQDQTEATLLGLPGSDEA